MGFYYVNIYNCPYCSIFAGYPSGKDIGACLQSNAAFGLSGLDMVCF